MLATSEALAGHYSVHDAPGDLRRQANVLTGELRGILARACLSALEPDSVILDEFQRFKELMDPETEAGGDDRFNGADQAP